MKIEVSVATFNEIAGKLEQNGVKLTDSKIITLEKGTFLAPPIDYRLVTIRRDCVIEATKIFKEEQIRDQNFIDLVDEIYQYVVFNKKPEVEKPLKFVNKISGATGGWSNE